MQNGCNTNEIYEYELLTNKIVFADGIPRTGKAMLNNLLLGFENFSSIQFINPMEQLLPMYIHGNMNKNSMSSFLRLYFNENVYNYKLSRNLNFRYDDLTSIHKAYNNIELHNNLSKPDGDAIVDELNLDKTYFQFQTHDLLTHYSKFLELGIDVILIELFRHPIDTIHSWYKRGWGKRFDNVDPRSGTTLFKYKGFTIPHYVVGYEEEYIKLNEMEKCVFMHNLIVKKSIAEYKKLKTEEKKKIFLVKYENLLLNPEEELDKMAIFLDTSKNLYMKKVMEEARVPRTIDISNRIVKLNEIKSNTNSSLVEETLSLSDYYENSFYEL